MENQYFRHLFLPCIADFAQSSPSATASPEPPVYSTKKPFKLKNILQNPFKLKPKPFTLKNILHCLRPLRANWMNIGVYLEVDTGTLKAIKADNDNVEDRLREMITVWLDRVSPPPTWSALADALEEVDQKTAQKIRLTFK